jgi:putative endopeptidase
MKKSCILALAPSSRHMRNMPAGQAACHNAEPATPTDFLAANLDTTVSPATDFFQYANGGWIKSTSIPAAERGWGVGNLVQEDIYQRLQTISQKAAAENAPAGSVSQKIGDLWTSGMDSTTIDSQGLATPPARTGFYQRHP